MKKLSLPPKKGTGKGDQYVVTTIRLERTMQEELDQVAEETGRSRNQIIVAALRFVLDNLDEILDAEEKDI